MIVTEASSDLVSLVAQAVCGRRLGGAESRWPVSNDRAR